MQHGMLRTDPYWDLTAKQRGEIREQRRAGFFEERLYPDRQKGWWTGGGLNTKGIGQWWQHTGHDLQKIGMDLGRTRLGQAFQNTGAGGIAAGIGLGIAAAVLFPISIPIAIGMDLFGTTGPSVEEIENIGLSLMNRPRQRFVNTKAAQTMRQATLSAMHNSVYSLRGAMGNEASMMHM